MKKSDRETVDLLLGPEFKKVYEDVLREHGATGQYRVHEVKVYYDHSEERVPRRDLDRRQHLAACRKITRAFSRLSEESVQSGLPRSQKEQLLEKAKDWCVFGEVDDRDIMRPVIASLEEALGFDSTPNYFSGRDFFHLLQRERVPHTLEEARAKYRDDHGGDPTREELYMSFTGNFLVPGERPPADERDWYFQRALNPDPRRDELVPVEVSGQSVRSPKTETSAQSPNDWLRPPEAAEYAKVTPRSITNWLKWKDEQGRDMLPNTRRYGRTTLILRADLEPLRKKQKQTRARGKSIKKRQSTKAVKPKK